MAKVIYDREACIGCAACTSVSSNWVMNADGDKVEPKKLEISAEELAENKEAESVCPVNAIKIEE